MTEQLRQNAITLTTMMLPYRYCCLGTFCQMFFTNGENTLTGDPLILDASFGNGAAKRLYHPTIMDHDRSTYDFAIHPQRLKDLDTDFVILCADRDTPLYYFDFIFHFPNLKQAWDESESERVSKFLIFLWNQSYRNTEDTILLKCLAKKRTWSSNRKLIFYSQSD